MNALGLWVPVNQQSIPGNRVVTKINMNITDINIHVLTLFINIQMLL